MGILNALAEVKMSFLTVFPIGKKKCSQENQKIISQNNRANGTITAVKTCWWIKINTKCARLHPNDGAMFPHIIYFSYSVNGLLYHGRRCVNFYLRCPNKGEPVSVFYDGGNPSKCTVKLYEVYL